MFARGFRQSTNFPGEESTVDVGGPSILHFILSSATNGSSTITDDTPTDPLGLRVGNIRHRGAGHLFPRTPALMASGHLRTKNTVRR